LVLSESIHNITSHHSGQLAVEIRSHLFWMWVCSVRNQVKSVYVYYNTVILWVNSLFAKSKIHCIFTPLPIGKPCIVVNDAHVCLFVWLAVLISWKSLSKLHHHQHHHHHHLISATGTVCKCSMSQYLRHRKATHSTNTGPIVHTISTTMQVQSEKLSTYEKFTNCTNATFKTHKSIKHFLWVLHCCL